MKICFVSIDFEKWGRTDNTYEYTVGRSSGSIQLTTYFVALAKDLLLVPSSSELRASLEAMRADDLNGVASAFKVVWKIELITIINKTGVINNPLGQTHSHANSEHWFLLFCFARFEKWGRYGWTTWAKTMIPTGRDFGLAEWINIAF